MPNTTSEAREQVLNVAEQLFMERGYSAVRLKDIADALNIKQASLYYHFPQGKEELYVEVLRHSLRRHAAGIQAALAQAPAGDWLAQLEAVASWLLSQPPVDKMSTVQHDLPEIHPETVHMLDEESFAALFVPILGIFAAAQASGQIELEDPDLVAGMFLGMINNLHMVKAEWNPRSKHQMAEMLIRLLARGLEPRPA
ncbi:MAG: TetR/AcrR family transcriptional regulator [Anaerolineae bacterium]|nr:TetR/AcrR family transcriptional regulator [Anaerolineae bacterium]